MHRRQFIATALGALLGACIRRPARKLHAGELRIGIDPGALDGDRGVIVHIPPRHLATSHITVWQAEIRTAETDRIIGYMSAIEVPRPRNRLR